MKFCKKPVFVDAVQYLGRENADEVKSFAGDSAVWTPMVGRMEIKTPEYLTVPPNYWVIKNSDGKFSVCNSDTFSTTYDKVE